MKIDTVNSKHNINFCAAGIYGRGSNDLRYYLQRGTKDFIEFELGNYEYLALTDADAVVYQTATPAKLQQTILNSYIKFARKYFDFTK